MEEKDFRVFTLTMSKAVVALAAAVGQMGDTLVEGGQNLPPSFRQEYDAAIDAIKTAMSVLERGSDLDGT